MTFTFSLILSLAMLTLPDAAQALMAGTAPDSPETRTDRGDSTSPFAGVGSLTIDGHVYTGTLIAPRYVLTAAHVASGNAPESIKFNLNSRGEITHQIVATAIYIYPGNTGFAAGKPAEGDLAIIKLAEPVPMAYPSYRISRQPLQAGSTLTIVGFGASGQGDVGATVAGAANVRRIGANNADLIRPGRDGKLSQALYYFDFDGPDESTNVFGGPSLGNFRETSLAGGDSGSPAFIRNEQGQWLIAGVNTFRFGQTSTFGNGGGGQVVASYADWIDSTLAPSQNTPSSALLFLSTLGLICGIGTRYKYTSTGAKIDL